MTYSPTRLVWLLVFLPGLAAAAGPPDGQASWAKYEVLLEGNIFDRQRGRAEREEREAAEKRAPAPEHYLFLRGVTRLNGEHVAFLEDMRSGEVLRARSGEAVLAGRVGKVVLDSVEYVKGGEARTVAVGQNLQRGNAPPEEGAAAGPAAASPAEGGAADILERLRRRREEELEQ